MRRDALVQPAGGVAVADKVGRLDHVDRVIHDRPDLAADLDLLERHDHCPDGSLARRALGKQVAELQEHTQILWLTSDCKALPGCMKHDRPDGSLARRALGKQVAKLQEHIN